MCPDPYKPHDYHHIIPDVNTQLTTASRRSIPYVPYDIRYASGGIIDSTSLLLEFGEFTVSVCVLWLVVWVVWAIRGFGLRILGWRKGLKEVRREQIGVGR